MWAPEVDQSRPSLAPKRTNRAAEVRPPASPGLEEHSEGDGVRKSDVPCGRGRPGGGASAENTMGRDGWQTAGAGTNGDSSGRLIGTAARAEFGYACCQLGPSLLATLKSNADRP